MCGVCERQSGGGLRCVPCGGKGQPRCVPCARRWEQCGGAYHRGTTCCEDGSKCIAQVFQNGETNAYYSQCLPA